MKISLGPFLSIYHSKFHNSRLLWGMYQVKTSGLCEIVVIIKVAIITTTPTIYWECKIYANQILRCIRWVLTPYYNWILIWNSKTLSYLSNVINLESSRARIWIQVYLSLESMFTPLCHARIDRSGRAWSPMCMWNVCVCVCTHVHGHSPVSL